jgi:membrane protease YdiL (CAAX protease family)
MDRATGLGRLAAFLGLLILLSVAGHFAASFLPRAPLGWVDLAMATAAALVAGWIVLARLDRRSPAALGFALSRDVPREIGAGLAVGGVLILIASALLFATGTARFAPDTGTAAGFVGMLVWSFLFFALAAANEEILFRGYPFQLLVRLLGRWPAVLVMSAAFSGAHAWNPHVDALAFLNIFLAGVLLALAYLRTRSLWFTTAVHAGWNWTMASLVGFPVSGLTSIDTPLYDVVEHGSAWWTGGGFGPEAGVAGTLALLLGIAWMLRTRRLRESPRMAATRPLVDRWPAATEA